MCTRAVRALPAASGRRRVATLLQRALQAAGSGPLGRRRTISSAGRAADRIPEPDDSRTDLTSNSSSSLMADTLSVTDNRTGKKYELPIQDGTIRAMDLRQIKTGARRLRADDVRPGVHEHGELPERHHLHRRRQGHPALPRLSHRAARRGERLPRDRLPDPVRRAAHRGAAAGVDARDHAPHDAAREHQEVHGGVPVRRASDGHLPEHRRRAVDASIRTRRTSSTRSRACARRTGSSPRCPASPPTPSATASAGRTSTRTTI